jgi:hypothetical protein
LILGGVCALNAAAQTLAEQEQSFRELVCGEAADFESPVHAEAVALVRARNYQDPRFDAAIRESLDDGEVELPDKARLTAAIDLMPHGSLSEADQVTLLLDTLVRFDDPFVGLSRGRRRALPLAHFDASSRFGVEAIVARLALFPESLAEALRVRLASGDGPAILWAAAELTGSAGEPLLPDLLDAARDGERSVRLAALRSTDVILRAIESDRETEIAVAADLDPKLILHAERIVSRYDRNADGRLSKAEQEPMLLAPVAADRDGDGFVTVNEYARYMQLRNRR